MNIDVKQFTIALANAEMNTADLARCTGISLNSIRAYVNKKRKPTTKAMGKIAKALNVDVTELLED